MESESIAQPWVCVVVLAFKHRPFLELCLASLEKLGLEGVQVLLVDNGSKDGSAEQMKAWAKEHPEAELLLLPENVGHCRAFNLALKQVKAPYVTDLAGDDALLTGSLRARVVALEVEMQSAFCYSNAQLISETGFDLGLAHQTNHTQPQGWVWDRLFGESFICPPTVLFRTEALKAIGGYDPDLNFEDFDVWMRLARNHQVVYTPAITVQYRQHANSASSLHQSKPGPSYFDSIYKIVDKAFALAKTPSENSAIQRFAYYHLRLAAYTGQPFYVKKIGLELRQNRLPVSLFWLWYGLSFLPLAPLYRLYLDARKRKPVPLN